MTPRALRPVTLSALGLLLSLLAPAGCSHMPPPPMVVERGERGERGERARHERHEAEERAERGETGKASYYATSFEGRTTASGEPYRGAELTAAHRTLPFGTRARVTNLDNGRSVEVVINDRGPHKKGRIVDVSRRAAELLGLVRVGLARVRLEILAESEAAVH